MPLLWDGPIGRFVTTNSLLTGLNVIAAWGQIQSHLGRYLGNWLLTGILLLVGYALLAVSFIILFGLVCTIPLLFTASFYFLLFQAHLMGQLYRTTL